MIRPAVNLVEAIALALEGVGGVDVDVVAPRIAEVLASPAAINRLSAEVRAAIEAAMMAHSLRDDQYRDPLGTDTLGEVAAAAVAAALCVDRRLTPGRWENPAEIGHIVASMRYRDGWLFTLTRLRDGRMAVRVTAEFEDTRRPGRFTTSRTIPIDGAGTVDAAFRAIMQIEEHEARETFQVAGKRPMDSHDPGFLPEPANRR